METNATYAITTRPQLTPTLWEMFCQIDRMAYESRRFGVTPGETAIKLIFCLENGLPLSTANTGLYIVNGRLAAMGNVIAAQLRRHPRYDYIIHTLGIHGCVIGILRDGEQIGEACFSAEDAERAGLLNKDNWKNYPTEMYFNRAITRAYKLYAPDLFSQPIYTPEELDSDVVINGTYNSSYTTLDDVPHSHQLVSLEILLTQYTPEEIMESFGGCIPTTEEEIQAVAEDLKARGLGTP